MAIVVGCNCADFDLVVGLSPSVSCNELVISIIKPSSAAQTEPWLLWRREDTQVQV